MLNLFLTIICTTAIGVVIKLAEKKVREPMTMLLGNYITASLTSVIVFFLSPMGRVALEEKNALHLSLSSASLILAPIGGAVFALNFFLMIVTIRKRGIALPVILMRMSAVVPVTVSLILFSESPSILQIAGVIGAFLAAILMSFGMEGGEHQKPGIKASLPVMAITSVGLLLCFGTADLIMKLFERYSPPWEKSLFLALLFGLAAFFVVVIILATRKRIGAGDLIWGVLLGVPNLFASYFIVSALEVLPAFIVFPAVASGTIMLITFIAITVFKEKARMIGVAGIFITFLAIAALYPR